MISIIVPVYGVEAYIEECLASVAAQTYGGPMECIVVDDCSPDASMDIARRFVAAYHGPIEFRLLRRERNGGLSEARNTGLDAARGKRIFYLDSDDTLPPDAIATLAAADADIVAGDLLWMKNGAAARSWLAPNPHTHAHTADGCARMILDERISSHAAWGKLVDADLARRVRFAPRMLCEDLEWCFRAVASARSAAFCQRPVYCYRVREGSIMTDPSRLRARYNDILLSLLRCARLAGGRAFARQALWILSHTIDFDTALRHYAGDAPVGADRLLRVFAATMRRLRRKARPWREPALWASLALLDAECRSGVRLRSRLFMPLHRAAKMFYNIAYR